MLDPRGPLFNDPREVLEEEFRRPGTYFSLLEELSRGNRGMDDLTNGAADRSLHPESVPGRAHEDAPGREAVARGARRDLRYRLADNFLRFWFRFVFPFQESLRAGPAAGRSLQGGDRPRPARTRRTGVREPLSALGTTQPRAQATQVEPWWGRALDRLRREGTRHSEEIDLVGSARSRVTVVGECKWTGAKMSAKVLDDLEAYKLPALRQDGLRFSTDSPTVLLFSKSGFKQSLVERAADRDDVRLIDLAELDRGLTA